MTISTTNARHKIRAGLGVAALGLGLLIWQGFASYSPAQSEPGNPIADFVCIINANTICPNCSAPVNPPLFGCVTQFPATWAAGTCDSNLNSTCREWLAFDCGQTLDCTTFLPGRNPCGKFNLCRSPA